MKYTSITHDTVRHRSQSPSCQASTASKSTPVVQFQLPPFGSLLHLWAGVHRSTSVLKLWMKKNADLQGDFRTDPKKKRKKVWIHMSLVLDFILSEAQILAECCRMLPCSTSHSHVSLWILSLTNLTFHQWRNIRLAHPLLSIQELLSPVNGYLLQGDTMIASPAMRSTGFYSLWPRHREEHDIPFIDIAH